MKTLRPSRLTPLPLLGAILLLGSALVPRPARAGDGVWTPIGPWGGNVRAMAFHPARPRLLWAGTETNGVFHSRNGGATWTAVNRGLPAPVRSVQDLEVAAAGSLTVYATISNTLYRSVGGGPWEERSSLPGFVRDVAADPHRERVLWADGPSPGIERSDDGGATWTQVVPLPGGGGAEGGARPTGFVFDPKHAPTLYTGLLSSASAPRGILRSRDGGVSWAEVSRGIEMPPPGQGSVGIHLAIAPDSGILFAAVEWREGTPEPGYRGLYRSLDRGDSWTLVLPGGQEATAGPGGLVLTRDGYRSLDHGKNWAPFNLPGGPPLLAAHPAAPGTVFAAPFQRGLLRSTDSASTWRISDRGIAAAQALDLAADPILPGTLYASVIGGGLFKTEQRGTVWERLLPNSFSFGAISELAVAPSGGETTLYALSGGSDPLGVIRSEDSGATWQNLDRPGDGSLHALAVDPKAPRTVYLGTDGIRECPARRSTDGGETWSCMPLGDTFELVVDPRRPANLWAISRTLFNSTDGGRTWKVTNRGLGEQASLETLAVDPSNSETAWLGTGNGLFKTTDGGRSWKHSGNGLPPAGQVIAVAVDPRNSSIVYAGINHVGVFRSTDGGRRWTRLQRGLPADFRRTPGRRSARSVDRVRRDRVARLLRDHRAALMESGGVFRTAA